MKQSWLKPRRGWLLFLKSRSFAKGVAAPKTVESFRIIFSDLDVGPSESSREFVVVEG